MTSTLHASAWRAAVLLLLLAAAAGQVSGAAGPVLSLQDPRSGDTVKVQAGPELLHLALFATWCHPCLDELERLETLEDRWRERGYRLVLIAVPSRQSRERLVRFVEDRSPPGRVLFDVDGEAQKILAAGELPTHILLDASGTEVLRAERVEDGVEDAVERVLLGDDR